MFYPLLFEPIINKRLWGEELWALSALQGNESVVLNGELKGNTLPELVEIFMGDLVGEEVFNRYETDFPLLFKFIDAQDRLSVQVHPDDEQAQFRYGEDGKTEMWYVLDAKTDAEIILGFRRKVTETEIRRYLRQNALTDILQQIKVRKGDAVYIPAGTVHALGAGVQVVEIQQSSDVTYRLYDYARRDKDGNLRELHIDDAIEVLDRNVASEQLLKYDRKAQKALIKQCQYFTTNLLTLDNAMLRDYSQTDSFVVYMCLDGRAEVRTVGNEPVCFGEKQAMLLPAKIDAAAIIPQSEGCKIMEVYIEQ
ncbi:MAG: class I mannose-6-phosphate isomerase [Paludibacteraceae bacterium]|nr:class I mannose-6-phosphate isomerase [Paludibacteraceae bacterium]MBR1786906.1 class I mannose-6-phosphate isomerase [Paludibacteraceae bacterium]